MSVQIINKIFPNLSEEQKSQFQQLETLYKDWNEKINVISRKILMNSTKDTFSIHWELQKLWNLQMEPKF